MTRVVIVPGLAVRSYVVEPAKALQAAGYEVQLEEPPGWPRQSPDLAVYGQGLAARLTHDQVGVQLLIGLSVGTQAAAVAAAHHGVEQLLLISPTVPPELRSRPRLLARFLRGEDHRDSPTWRSQLPDWRRAGPRRILSCFRSATEVVLEEVLPTVGAAVTVVHGDADRLSSYAYAAQLAACCGARLVLLPDAPHSWPVGDPARFVGLVDTLTEDLL